LAKTKIPHGTSSIIPVNLIKMKGGKPVSIPTKQAVY
jgi:hypothetical protein